MNIILYCMWFLTFELIREDMHFLTLPLPPSHSPIPLLWGLLGQHRWLYGQFPPLFSTALCDLVNSRRVHSLMWSSHLFLCLPCLFCLLAFFIQNSTVHPIMSERIACAAVSPHLYILSYLQAQCYPPLRQLHPYVGDFNAGVCHVIKIILADCNPNMGLLTQWRFCLSPDVLTSANNMPIMTTSVASGQGPPGTFWLCSVVSATRMTGCGNRVLTGSC